MAIAALFSDAAASVGLRPIPLSLAGQVSDLATISNQQGQTFLLHDHLVFKSLTLG